MSWLSNKLDKVRTNTDTLGARLGLSNTQRKWFRTGVASMGGGMGLQYEYSRNKGMNSSEATVSSISGGATYQQDRAAQRERVAADNLDEQTALALRVRSAQDRADRLGKEVRVRRGRRADLPGNKGGTLLTGALGLTDGFAGMLGA